MAVAGVVVIVVVGRGREDKRGGGDGGALDGEGGDGAGVVGGVDEPVGVGAELRGITHGFLSEGIGDGGEGEEAARGGGEGEGEFGPLDAHKVLGVGVEHVGGEGAGGAVEKEFEIKLVVTELDEETAVGGGVGMTMAVAVGAFGRVGVVVAAAGGEEERGGAEEGGEGVRGVHQRPEQAGPLRPADRVGRRVPAGLVSVFDGRKFEFRPIKPIYST